jgi:hypothetical protein
MKVGRLGESRAGDKEVNKGVDMVPPRVLRHPKFGKLTSSLLMAVTN